MGTCYRYWSCRGCEKVDWATVSLQHSKKNDALRQ